MSDPLRRCAMAGCWAVIRPKNIGDRYCPKCLPKVQAKLRDRFNEKQTDKFLGSRRWRKLRKLKITSDPLCEDCLQQGKTTGAEEIHHVKARQEFPELAYAFDNLRSLCLPHHRAATARERVERARRAQG